MKKENPSFSSGILGWIERVGNKIPHPFILFIWLFFIVAAVAFLCGKAGVSAINPSTGEEVFAVNVLSSASIGEFLRNMSKNFMNFAPMMCVPLCVLGIGVAHGSGLIDVSMNLTGASKNLVVLTYICALIGVCTNLLGDAGFLILPVIVAMLFQSTGRNPLAGMLLAYCSNCVGYGANLLISTGDAVLAGLTETAAQLIDPDFVASPTMGWYFMAASSFIVAGCCTYVSMKIVEPRMRRNGIGESVKIVEYTQQDLAITPVEKKGMLVSLSALLACIGVCALMCLPGMP